MVVEATLYDADGRDRHVELDGELLGGIGEHQVLWVDLADRAPAAIERVRDLLHLGEETARRLARGAERPKVDRYEGWIHLSFLAMDAGPDRPNETAPEVERGEGLVVRPIDGVIGRNYVITVHDGAIAAFDEFRDHVRGDSRLGELDAASFMAALVDTVLAGYLREVERVERRIDRLDNLALEKDDAPQFLDEVVALRRVIATLRGSLGPHRAALAPLGRPDMEVEAVGNGWPGLVDRLDRAIDAVDTARESLIGAFDIYMARSAQRTNEVMKVLTILNAVLLPAVVLAGVMGMNFHPGFFDQPWLFYVVVGAMLALAVTILSVARARRWI